MLKYGRKGLSYLEILKSSLQMCALVLMGKHIGNHNIIKLNLINSDSPGMAALRKITALVRMGMAAKTTPTSQA